MDPFKNTLQTIEINIHESKLRLQWELSNKRLVNQLEELASKGAMLEGYRVKFNLGLTLINLRLGITCMISYSLLYKYLSYLVNLIGDQSFKAKRS